MTSFDLAKHTLLSTTAGLLVALGVSVSPGTASAQGIILACVDDTTGAFRKVATQGECLPTETLTFWNRPCLSGYNPHPLYVGCAVIRQARVSEWKLMF